MCIVLHRRYMLLFKDNQLNLALPPCRVVRNANAEQAVYMTSKLRKLLCICLENNILVLDMNKQYNRGIKLCFYFFKK